MTPLELEEFARNRYNAVGDTFFTQAELMRVIYDGCCEIARESLCIERVFTTTTVADQQEYDYPENAISIKRVTYNGNRIDPISFDEDDSLSLSNSAVTVSGTPAYYVLWDESFYLRPIPDSANTLKVFAYVEPQPVTSTSTLEVPTQWHTGIGNKLLAYMHEKDKQFDTAKYYEDKWQKTVMDAKRFGQKKRRGGRFAAVKDEESLPKTVLGTV